MVIAAAVFSLGLASWFGPSSKAQCLHEYAAKGATQLAVRVLSADCGAEFATEGQPRRDELDRIYCRREAVLAAKTDLGVAAARRGCEERYPVPASIIAAAEKVRQAEAAAEAQTRFEEYATQQHARWIRDASEYVRRHCEFNDETNYSLLRAGVDAFQEAHPTEQTNAVILDSGAQVARASPEFRPGAGCSVAQSAPLEANPTIIAVGAPPSPIEKPPACEYGGVMTDEEIRRCQGR